MKIKTPTEFVSFSDGICNIYSKDDDGNRENNKYKGLGFNDRVLGFKKFFAAQANHVKVDRVIRIPLISKIDGHDCIEINNIEYEIKLMQIIQDTNPPSIDLTLEKV